MKKKKNNSNYSKESQNGARELTRLRRRWGKPSQLIGIREITRKISFILFLLLVFFLPTQFGRHFFFDFSYLSGVRVDYLAPTLYFTDIIIFLLAALNWKYLLDFFKNKKILIFLSLLIVNILFSQSIPLAFYRFVKIIEFFILFGLTKKFITTNNCHPERSQDYSPAKRGIPFSYSKEISPPSMNRGVEMTKKVFFKLLLLSLTLTTFIQAIHASLQFINKHSIQGIFYFLGERSLALSTPNVAKGSLAGVEILRPYATFSHPNSMGGFFLLIYFFVLIYKPFNYSRLLKPFFLLLSTILVFLSFSKVAIVTFLILNFFYLFRKISQENICRICGFSKIAIILALAFIFLNFKSDPLSLDKRIYLINNSITIFKDHFLNGVGLNNYLLAQDKIPSHYLYFFNQPVHNIFFLFITEAGIIIAGFTLWQLFLLGKKYYKKEVFLFAVLVVILTGFFDHYWLSLQQNFLLIALVFGLIM